MWEEQIFSIFCICYSELRNTYAKKSNGVGTSESLGSLKSATVMLNSNLTHVYSEGFNRANENYKEIILFPLADLSVDSRFNQ